MPRLYTSTDLIAEVRSLLDEENQDSIEDATDIIPSLNRAYKQAFLIMSDVYPEPILDFVDIAIDGSQETDIPENIFEDKIKFVEFRKSGNSYKVNRVSITEFHKWESSVSIVIPEVYTIYNRKIKFCAIPTGGYTLRVWVLKELDVIVRTDGRITKVGSDYLILGDVHEDLDPGIDDMTSYMNIIDGQTGKVKSSFQALSFDGLRLKVRPNPARTTVINRTVSASLTEADVDDYVCHIKGTCVPIMLNLVQDYIIQYSLSELKRNKLGMPYDVDQKLVKEFEKQLKNTFLDRPKKNRIIKNNPHWRLGTRLRFRRGF